MRFLNKDKNIYQVWATSAISNRWKTFLIQTDKGVRIIVPKNVLEELRRGQKNHLVCKEAYNYILNNDNIIIYEKQKKFSNMDANSQAMYISKRYTKRGYNVELVTCNKAQAYLAKLNHVKVNLLVTYSEQTLTKTTNKKSKKTGCNINHDKKENLICFTENGIEVNTYKINSKTCILAETRIEVYNKKGKRKIGKDNFLEVDMGDRFVYKGINYKFEKLQDGVLYLLKY